ncbi:MAG: GNAT family N-acetyltransferase [Marinomonas sp.]
MAEAPELNSEPLRLVPFAQRHFSDDYIGWLNDPVVVRYSEQRHRSHDRKSCETYVASFETSPHLLWAIELADGGAHIGNLSATIDVHNCIADIGILIGATGSQGLGYGGRAWACALDYLTSRSDLRKVTGGCLEANAAMVKIMQRCGMKEDGIRPSHYIVEDRVSSLLFFAKAGSWQPGS